MLGRNDMLVLKQSESCFGITSTSLTHNSEIEHIWQMCWRTSFYRGGPVFMSALAGIDIALWDLKARKLNVPIYQLLGGKVRDKLKVYAWIGGDRPSDVKTQA
jgi:galactonate dehydratase